MTYVAIEIKYLIKLCLLLRKSWRDSQEKEEERRDSTRRHDEENKITTWAINDRLLTRRKKELRSKKD